MMPIDSVTFDDEDESDVLGHEEVTLAETEELIAREHSAPSASGSSTLFTRSVTLIIIVQALLACSFYAVLSVVAIYLNQKLGFTEDKSSFITNSFNFANFMLSVVGGYLADARWGRYRTIIIASAVATVGYGLMVLAALLPLTIHQQTVLAFAGLGLVALGNGASMPCLSSFVGDQLEPHIEAVKTDLEKRGLEERISSFYRWFYLSYNLGAVIGSIGTPMVVSAWSYREAYTLLFVLAVLSIPVLLLGRRQYVVLPAAPLQLSILTKGTADRVAINTLLRVFLPLPIFWMLFSNTPSLWTFSALHMDRHIGSFEAQPGQITALNPLFDITLIPLFEFVIFPAIKRCGIDFRPIRRMVVGMILAAASLVLAGLVQIAIDHSITVKTVALTAAIGHMAAGATSPAVVSDVSVFWQLPQYLLMSCAEILVSITALEFAYTHAPVKLKGLCMAVFFLTQAIGNELVAIAALVNFGSTSSVYFFFAGVMMLFMVLFVIITWNLDSRASHAVSSKGHAHSHGAGSSQLQADWERDEAEKILNEQEDDGVQGADDADRAEEQQIAVEVERAERRHASSNTSTGGSARGASRRGAPGPGRNVNDGL